MFAACRDIGATPMGRLGLLNSTSRSLVFLALLLSGCTNFAVRVERLVEGKQFVAALQILEKGGAGRSVSPNVDVELLKAREAYTAAYEAYLKNRVDTQLHMRMARKATQVCQEYKILCPWSVDLSAKYEELSERIGRIDSLINRWKNYSHLSDPYNDFKRFSDEIKSEKEFLGDSSDLLQALQVIRDGIIDHWALEISRQPPGQLGVLADALAGDKAYLVGLEKEVDRAVWQLHATSALSLTANVTVGTEKAKSRGKDAKVMAEMIRDEPFLASDVQWRALYSHHWYEAERQSAVKPLRSLFKAVAAHYLQWLKDEFSKQLLSEGVHNTDIECAECVVCSAPTLVAPEFIQALARAHATFASRYAANATFAKIALLHIVRSEQLMSGENLARNGIRERANATILAAKLPTYQLVIDADPKIDPQVFIFLRLCLAAEVRERSGDKAIWQFGKPGVDTGNVKLYFSDAQFHIPTSSDLHETVSSYMSHFEDVPNPQKAELKRRLNAQDLEVSLAKSNYNSAVSNYNIWGNNYALQAVNRARTDYNYAVDRYNELVESYNSSPATISRPVYLPYKFSQGTVSFGFGCKAQISIGERVTTTSANNIQQAEVRYGTRVNDKNAATRRDVGMNMDISSEALLRKAEDITTRMVDALGEALLQLNDYKRLAEDEQMGLTAAWLLHPFGPQPSIAAKYSISPWVGQAAKKLEFPRAAIQPPVTQVDAPSVLPDNGSTAKKLSEYYSDLVCTINASSPLGSSVGSGVVISGDGLVLTCAHVLEGNTITVTFFRDGRESTYQADLVFVNERADAALIRCKDYRFAKWAPVRLAGPARKGEAIVAIGNPALVEGQTVRAAISQGIVASPEFVLRGSSQLVCDITVASGSSGGPIISLEDGRILGVVVAVQKAGLKVRDGDVSASGYSCVAVPTVSLLKTLGLTLSPK